jgi:hypothetical protein
MSRFQTATRKKLKLRMAIDGPPGAGKTATALRLTVALAARGNGRIAVIDTEHRSASKYVDQKFDDDGPFQFDVLELTSFSPTEYTGAIEEAGREQFDVLVIDSLSHAWSGKDGALEIKDKAGGNQFTAWKNVTPMHNRMVEAILQSPCHVIVTMRSKVDYVLERNEAGKEVPKKVGMAPIQRPGMEYEFDIYGAMDWSHIMTITKSRCPSVDGWTGVKPGSSFMAPVIDWLETGEVAEVAATAARITDEQLAGLLDHLNHLGVSIDKAKADILKKYAVQEFSQLNADQAEEYIGKLAKQLANRKKQANQQANGEHSAAAHDVALPDASPAAALAAERPEKAPAFNRCPSSHLKTIAELHGTAISLGLTQDQYKAALTKRGVATAKDLTAEQATEFVAKLRERIETLKKQKGGEPAAVDQKSRQTGPTDDDLARALRIESESNSSS